MRRWIVLAVLGWSGCLGPPLRGAGSPGQGHLHVSRNALPGGDGTPARPFRTLAEALPAAGPAEAGELVVHVSTGDYEGPLVLRPGVRVVGEGTVLLHAGGDCAVRAEGSSLEHLMLQGGAIGLCAAGRVTARDVTFSGQREAAIRLSAGSQLDGARLRLEATVSEIQGLVLPAGARAWLSSSLFEGPFRRAVEAESAELELRGVEISGAVTGVRALSSVVRLQAVSIQGGRGTAIHLGQGTRADVESLSVLGHEFALSAGEGVQLNARGVKSRDAEHAALTLQRADAQVKSLEVTHAGNLGAVQAVDSRLVLAGLRVEGAVFAGVQLVGGEARIAGAHISGVQREVDGEDGHGLLVQRGKLQLEDVVVERADGSGLMVGSHSAVQAARLEFSDVRQGAVTADGQSTVSLGEVHARRVGEALLVALGGASIWAGSLQCEQPTPVAWADCPGGARVAVKRYAGPASTAGSACESVGR